MADALLLKLWISLFILAVVGVSSLPVTKNTNPLWFGAVALTVAAFLVSSFVVVWISV